MKLGKKYILSTILTLLFMIFITSITIKYLYNNSNITKDEYFELLLSDTYGDNFYIKLVETINKNFNPLNIIEMKEVTSTEFNLHNDISINNPSVYIYNTNMNDEYEEEYNVKPNVFLASFFLSENLNNLGVETIFENNDIEKFSKNNNLTIKESSNVFINDKLNNYPSIKYIINLGRTLSKNNTVVKINNKKYAVISLYANKENISLISDIHSKLNERYKGISKIYFEDSYNSSMNIDFGSNKNTMKEVLNSIEVFSNIFKEAIS